MRVFAASAIAAVMALGLAGCYESPTATLHKPGEYKGPTDPLTMNNADQRAEALQQRFSDVQTDR